MALRGVVQDLDGHPVELGSTGSIRVVEFWATWCAPCLEQMPDLEQIAADYAAGGVEVVAVSVDDDRNALDQFLARRPTTLRVLWDPMARATRPYVKLAAALAIPTTLVVDASGHIVDKLSGGSRMELLRVRGSLDRLLAEPPG